ncbi:MAG: hypothetical protein WAR79_00335 [Melioribacteraceae bacterium]
MKNIIDIYFDSPKSFELGNVKTLSGIVGLYFIFSSTIEVQYPFTTSKLLYIGMSERKTNSIGTRLDGHFKGTSKNVGLMNYRKVEPLLFTYINFDIIKSNWKHRIEDLESYFILDFVDKHGVYPICNNKTGFEVQNSILKTEFKIDWSYFK